MTRDATIHAQERFGVAMNSGKLDEFDDVVTTGCVNHDPEPGQGPGPQGFKDLFTGLRSSFMIKFLLTAFATAVLIVHTQLIGLVAHAAANGALHSTELGAAKAQVTVAAGGALVVLLVITAHSVYRPGAGPATGCVSSSNTPPRQQQPRSSP
ncbi:MULTISPECIES: hypothetical protein [unclassified Arthrobacter]|uniref:hypothetical protein n=1 Tax=unclassified Pseudarthrobacter TaxID=2647000 RepID=UPI003396B6D9